MPSPGKKQIFDPASISALGRLDWIAEALVNGSSQGFHRSRQRGFSTEFSEHKPYTHGDDPRFLDWRIYARTRKPYIRCFEAETNMECCLILDSSRSMSWTWQNTPSKLQYATNLCSALAYFFLGNQDRVGLVTGGNPENPTVIPPSSRRSQLPGLLTVLENLSPSSGPVLVSLSKACLDHFRKRGQVIVFSDLEEDRDRTATALAELAGAEHDVLIVHILHQSEITLPFGPRTTHLEDHETGRRIKVDISRLLADHAEQLEIFKQYWHSTCAEHAISYAFIDTSMDYLEALNRLFRTKR